MSDLLNKASLVVIPSGYKEDTVYSVVPSDGSGDLSFTRASNGTRVNSAGLVEVTPWNLVQYSEDFTNAYWSKDVGASVDSNVATAPNGTTTADRLNFAGAGQAVYTIQSFGGENTFSVYLKGEGANIGKQIYLEVGVTSTVTLTGEWQRFEVVANSAASVAIKRNTSGQASAVLAWGIQMNIGALKPYFPTTDRLNVPRLTYQNGGGGCPSLLLEKQSTNLVTYSEQLDNAAWIKLNGSVTANIAVSPDGTSNADAFIPNTTSGVHALRSNLFNQSATASHSWFVKANGYTKIAVRESELVGNYATFNLTTGTLISTNQTGSIQNLGNGWYRCTLVDTTTGVNAQTSIVVLPDSYTSGDPIVVNWSGDGTKGVFAWGAQVEISTYPTSYIPTTSASATRVADACFKTGISSLIGQSEGTMFCEFNAIGSYDTNNMICTLSDGTGNNRIFLNLTNGVGNLEAVITASGSTTVSFVGSTPSIGRHKIAIAYKSNDVVLYLDGTLLFTDTSVSIPATSKLNIGSYFNETFPFNSGINQAVIFPTRLTNAELASLTTI